MAKFNAATAVEPMEYDFTAFDGPVGIIPEPSQGQIDAFFRNLKEVRLFIGGIVGEAEELAEKSADMKDVQEFVEKIPEDRIKEYQEKFSVWVHEVSSATLEVDMLERLPGRVFAAFFRWLAAELGPKDVKTDSPV